MWDTRSGRSTLTVQAHAYEVLCTDWCKYNDCLLATASVDKSLKLWDVRNPQRELATLLGHTCVSISIVPALCRCRGRGACAFACSCACVPRRMQACIQCARVHILLWVEALSYRQYCRLRCFGCVVSMSLSTTHLAACCGISRGMCQSAQQAALTQRLCFSCAGMPLDESSSHPMPRTSLHPAVMT